MNGPFLTVNFHSFEPFSLNINIWFWVTPHRKHYNLKLFAVLVLFGLNPTKRKDKFVFSPDIDKNDERKVFVYFHFVSFIWTFEIKCIFVSSSMTSHYLLVFLALIPSHMTHVVSNRTSETANYITFEMNSRGAKFLNSLGFLCSRKTFKKFHYPIAERF